MSEFPRIVVIAPFVPKRLVEDAGQRYLGELARVLPDDAVFIVPKDRRSLRDANDVQEPRVLLVDVVPPSIPRTRSGKAYQFSREQIIPIRARDGFWEGLRTNRAAREAMLGAQVIDLQWPEFASLAPRIRRVMPHARLIVTMHDVPSQGKAHELRAALAGRSPRGAVRLAAAVSHTGLMEYGVAAADLVVVFSEKDRGANPGQGTRNGGASTGNVGLGYRTWATRWHAGRERNAVRTSCRFTQPPSAVAGLPASSREL